MAYEVRRQRSTYILQESLKEGNTSPEMDLKESMELHGEKRKDTGEKHELRHEVRNKQSIDRWGLP